MDYSMGIPRPAPSPRVCSNSCPLSQWGQNVDPWWRRWQATSVFLPWEPHEQCEKMVSVQNINEIFYSFFSIQPSKSNVHYTQIVHLDADKLHFKCSVATCGLLFPYWSSRNIIRSLSVSSGWGFPDSSVGKESTCNAGDPGSIPGSGRSAGAGIGYPLQYSWASLVAQLVKNLLMMRETWVPFLGWEDPLEKAKATHSSILAWRIPWTRVVHGVSKSWTQLSGFFTFFSGWEDYMHWCHFIVSCPFHISQISVMDTYRFGNLELK